jgi:hypothetical protein
MRILLGAKIKTELEFELSKKTTFSLFRQGKKNTIISNDKKMEFFKKIIDKNYEFGIQIVILQPAFLKLL